MTDRCHLDPAPPISPVRFRRQGNRWFLGNRPTRLALEIAENDNGELQFAERDPSTWETVEEEAA